MGLNICLYKSHYEEHPDWDYLRVGHDRDFAKLVNWDKVNYLVNEYQEDYGFTVLDIPELRNKVIEQGWSDESRYLQLLHILETEPESYLYFSY